MKAVVVERPGETAVREVPDLRPIGPLEARVQVVCGSLCNGTDLKIVRGTLSFVQDYPAILGHEVVGRVVEVGERVRTFRLGEFVSRPHAAPPSDSGLSEAFGGFSEYGIVTDVPAQREAGLAAEDDWYDQFPAPADSDPVALTQMVTLRETLAFLTALGVRDGQSILIFGTGPVGISFSLMARQLELSPVIVVGRRREALDRAVSLGRATHTIDSSRENVPQRASEITQGKGADWAIEAIGTSAVLQDAIDSLSPTGFVGPYGIAPAQEYECPMWGSERIKSVDFREETACETIGDWVSRGLVPAREFVDRQLPMAEVARGLELIESRQAFKVLLWVSRG